VERILQRKKRGEKKEEKKEEKKGNKGGKIVVKRLCTGLEPKKLRAKKRKRIVKDGKGGRRAIEERKRNVKNEVLSTTRQDV